MAKALKTREPALPRIESEGELVGYFATEESGKLREVRKRLHEMLPKNEQARIERRDFYLRTYRLHFCGGGGDWDGKDAANVPGVMNGGVTLEFWPDGVALRFAPFSFCSEDSGSADDETA